MPTAGVLADLDSSERGLSMARRRPACEDMLREVSGLVAEEPAFRLNHVIDAVE